MVRTEVQATEIQKRRVAQNKRGYAKAVRRWLRTIEDDDEFKSVRGRLPVTWDRPKKKKVKFGVRNSKVESGNKRATLGSVTDLSQSRPKGSKKGSKKKTTGSGKAEAKSNPNKPGTKSRTSNSSRKKKVSTRNK